MEYQLVVCLGTRASVCMYRRQGVDFMLLILCLVPIL